MYDVVIDASNVCRTEAVAGYDVADWSRLEAVERAFREQVVPDGRSLLVADLSLLGGLDERARAALGSAQRARRAEVVRWADELILERAQQWRAFVISNDRFGDLRHRFPGLRAGWLLRFTIANDGSATLERAPDLEVDPAERSRVEQEADRARLGLRDESDRWVLNREWRCHADGCPQADLPCLSVLPVYRYGDVRCPVCEEVATEVGVAGATVELKVLLGDDVVMRFPLPQGARCVVGRGGGPDRLDVTELAGADKVLAVSRDHLRLENRDGSVLVEELGSTNGTDVSEAGGPAKSLTVGVRRRLSPSLRVHLPAGIDLQVSSKRYVRGGFAGSESPPVPAGETAWGGDR